MPGVLARSMYSVLAFMLCAPAAFAHNGSVAYAYPLGKITIDGNFSDWPKDVLKYRIGEIQSETKPLNDADFSGFFQLGYSMENRSLYVAFTITDDNFMQDTSENVRWNTQDGLELSIDGRHLLTGSGVASFMYSKKLRNINKSFYDPFTKDASWDIIEVAMTTSGTTRFYEWRIQLGSELTVGKSVGFDFHVFDKDPDKSFTYSAWGKGEQKFINPKSLGDVVILPANAKLASVSGQLTWDKKVKDVQPGQVMLRSMENKKNWLEAAVDSTGSYTVLVLPGNYQVSLPEQYITRDDRVYSMGENKPILVNVKAGQKNTVKKLTIPIAAVPDLLPEKGILPRLTSANTNKVDEFIEAYRKYYNIPGVSLALVKDGKMVYHKTYGVRNTITGEKVDDNTLFEAASITKPVFALAVERLSERGVIDLDKPLYLYLPYPDIAYDERYKLITARHVLTHRTGFPNWRSMNEDGRLDIKFTPGTEFGYSGEGFEYLKMVIEKITGKKVEQVLQEEVIEPIGLYHTFFSKNDSLQRMVANGHFDGLPSNNDLPESPGMAYSMHTEAVIFTRFMIYLLEEKGLKPETYEMIMKKASEYKLDPGEEKPKFPTYFGTSLEIRETPFGKSFGHGGNNGDFKCKFEVYKDAKLGYAIFTNSNTSDALLENIRKFLIEGKDQP